MTQRSSLETVRELYGAFGRGDLPAILDLLDSDIAWEYPGAKAVPWAGSFRGRDGVRRFFSAILEATDIEAFEPRSFVAQGDAVVVLGFQRVRSKRTGRSYDAHWATAWTVSGGKITTFQEYTDTAAEAAALADTGIR
jgi:ketosteroid isomerase-like protein